MRLAAADPGNAGWQRDLSVSYRSIGDLLTAQGNLSEALKSYRDSLAITEKLAAADPSNASWALDLAEQFAKIGKVRSEMRMRDDALNSFQKAISIVDRLAELDPTNANWIRNQKTIQNEISRLKQ